MKNEQFTNFIKDMSKAAKKIATNVAVLDTMTNAQVGVVQNRLANYNPVSEEGRNYRSDALNATKAELENRAKTSVVTDLGAEIGQRVAENSTVLEFHVRQPGFTKKINSETFLDKSGNNGKVDADILHVNQDLIDKRFVKALMDHRGKILDYIRAWEVPGGMLTLGGGQFLVPLKAVTQIYEKIDEFGKEREALLDEFQAKWDDIVKDAKKKRGVFFDANDYPPFASIRDRFTHDFRFISNAIPTELEKAGREIYLREHERRMLECAATATDIQAALREGFNGLIKHFTERLGVDEATGKPKRFNAKRLEDMKEFLNTFEARNLTNDAELTKITEKARLLLDGLDADQIRKGENVRTSLKKSFDELVEVSDSLIDVRHRRVRAAE